MWSPDAAKVVLDVLAPGTRYFIQQFGQTTWDAATGSPISALDAAEGIQAGLARPRPRVLPGPLERATPAERDYLGRDGRGRGRPQLDREGRAPACNKKPTSLGPTLRT